MPPYGFGGKRAARRRRAIGGTPTPSPTPTPTPTPTPAASLPQEAAIVAHFNASDMAALADGTAIANWADSSANGATAAQATGARQPKYRTAGLNGRPCVEFDGVDDMLTIAAPGALKTALDSRDYTVMVVVDNVTAGSGGFGNIFGTAHGGDTVHVFANGTDAGQSGAALGAVPYGGTGYKSFGIASTATSTAGGSSGGNLRRYFARGGIFSSVAGTGRTTSDKTLCIGGGNADATPTFFFKGRIYRIIIWSRLLSPAEAQQAEAYFNDYYGQTHPAIAAGKMLHIDGDSRHAGVGATGTNASAGVAYKIAQGLSLPLGAWSLYAIGGLSIQSCINKGGELDAAAAALPGIAHRLLYEESFNSRALPLGTIATPGTMAYQTRQYVTARRAGMGGDLKVIGCSPMDHADLNSPSWGSHGWAAYMQANWAALGFDGLADIWASALGGDGACPNASPYTPWTDGVHLTSAGQTTQAAVAIAACGALSGF